jgi:uncharacterized protein YtpQ (UPF0354 family)
MGFFDRFKKGKEAPTNSDPRERGYVNVGRSIFPVIKSKSDKMLQIGVDDSKIITKELCEDACVAYALDTGKQYVYLSNARLREFGIPLEDLEAIALRNLKALTQNGLKMGTLDFSDQNPQIKPFYALMLDGNLEPSMMLVDEFWNHAQTICNDDVIAVSIPARDELFFSPFKLIESFRTMKVFASKRWDEAVAENRGLSGSLYIRKKGKWYQFREEPDFFEKMYTE